MGEPSLITGWGMDRVSGRVSCSPFDRQTDSLDARSLINNSESDNLGRPRERRQLAEKDTGTQKESLRQDG